MLFLLQATEADRPQIAILAPCERRRQIVDCHFCSMQTMKGYHRLSFLLYSNDEDIPQTVTPAPCKRRRQIVDCHFCSMQTTKTYSRLPSFLYSKTKTYHRLPFLLDSNDEDRPQTAVLAPGNRRRQDYKLSYMFQATTKTEHTAISAPLTMTDDRLPTLLQRTDKNRL